MVTVTDIGDDRTALFAVSFFSVRDGRIVAAEEYLGDDDPPPFDRSVRAERYRMAVDRAGVRFPPAVSSAAVRARLVPDSGYGT